MSTATAAVTAAEAGQPSSSQTTSVTTAITSTIGTNTPEMRSARRCTFALPDCASSTRRAICASWVSSPTRVARTTRRPPAFTVAPTTASPAPTSTGTDSPVTIEASTADVPDTIDAVGRDLLARPHDELVSDPQRRDRDAALHAVADHRDVLRAEFEQSAQRGAGAALGAHLEVAPREHEHRHAGGDLEVDVVGAVAALHGPLEHVRHAGHAGVRRRTARTATTGTPPRRRSRSACPSSRRRGAG